ncbi:cytochrome c [Orrella sp. JC864]|uniref:SorU family sulfite dehydrogenase c-type cytochrome subunit n=1 Tax=Orrella sp. JC864 TaxID=3120298 RepID=UPI00300B6415
MRRCQRRRARPQGGAALLAAALLLGAAAAPAAAGEVDMEAGRALFLNVTPACAICHTLADAQAGGAIGPVLDEIKPDAPRVAQALRNGIGQMPAYSSLSEEEIALLSAYVAKASGGAP